MAGERKGGYLKTRCRCGAEVWCDRAQASRPQTCPKCGVAFRVGVSRDAQGREQVSVAFPPGGGAGAPAAPNARKRTKPGLLMRNVRDSEVAPIVPERPREPNRDGQFVMDMLTDPGARERKPEGGTSFEEAEFGAENFEDATFSQREIVQPYSAKRETMPGVMYTTCPCGEPALVKKGDIGRPLRCPGCGRMMMVEGTRDPQTREIVIRMRPVDSGRR